MRKLLFIYLFISACSTSSIPDFETLENIKIARDQWGVPHIIAPTDKEVAYGLAWAQCEDDFVTLQEQMLAIRGQLGKVKGKEGVVADFGIQFMGLRETVEEKYEQDLSADFRAYLESYVDAVNSFAMLYPEEILLEDLFPLLPQDIVIGYLLGMVDLTQAGKHLEKIMNGEIFDDVRSNFPKGSNAIAISKNKTTDGKTYLAINSHQPLEGWYSWYEAHLISEEGLNILGGTFPGGVTIFHGANENLGWAHTVNHPDLSDVYKLEMHPERSNVYNFDGEWIDLEEIEYKAKVKVAGFINWPVSRTIYRSKYGPTFKTDEGYFAWRYVAGQDIRAAEQWYRMNKAKSFEEFKTALNMQSIPSTNIVYADRKDNIYYISNAHLPVRNEAYNWREVLPGNTSQTLWNSYYPIDSLPQVLNPASGWVFNTNNSPFSATDTSNNAQESATNHTMSFQTPDMENARSIRFLELISQYDSLNYEDFKRIKYDQKYGSQILHRNMMNLELFLNLNPNDYPDIEDAILQLNAWDRGFDIKNTTAPLYIYALNTMSKKLKAENRYCWRCEIKPEDIAQAIQQSKSFLLEKYNTLSVPLGEFQRHIRGDKSLPLGGGPDVLGAMYSKVLEDGTHKGVAGESYIELVRFSENEEVEIESVHAYGSSAEPESPHYDDQMELFVNQKLKKMTLNREEVLRQAKTVYSPKRVIISKQNNIQ